ncbi:TVP38/TMEM64 family protein [Vibrio olivae]|uniref:TVP38/TMEM64 family membrane protein n=1 Tax=Vibrio olivae TaxID=1243002 RepID=A0ABV5HHR0_9VIBR
MYKKILLAALLLLIIVLIVSQTRTFITLESAKHYQQQLALFIEQNFVIAASIYFVAYVLITALSIPGATIITLLGAALFGFWFSLLLVSFASTLGATCAFLLSRYFFQNWVQTRFGDKLEVINQGIKKDGAYYLFSLRLIPIFPFFVINLVMGLTPIAVRQFYFVSQIGMLPGTTVYLNAGTQLAQIDSLSGIVSPAVLLSFALLGIFPILIKWVVRRWKLTPSQ